MAGSMRLPELHVEGKNDMHAIGNLLKKHGLECRPKIGPVHIEDHGSEEGEEAGRGIDELLRVFEYTVRQSANRCVGFVVDADDDFPSRWNAVADRLRNLGAVPPPAIPSGGLILNVDTVNAKVGVWIMPDNQSRGALEDFLRSLVDDGDPVIGHAEQATDIAGQLGASFRAVDRLKAILHTWLAWQSNPGRPYGTAINNEYFKSDHQLAVNFIAWFCNLYGLGPTSPPAAG